jgi:hypothetical protein
MREIKFRGWDKNVKRMEYWDDLLYEMFCAGIDIFNGKKFELMQFTGLYDSKGVEIYEGDICEWKGGGNLISGNIFAVKWVDKRAAWYIGDCLNPIDMGNVKVIGNIYSNPEIAQSLHKEKNV